MNVVVTHGAREKSTPRELTAAYKDFIRSEAQYLNAESGLKAVAYRFGTDMLIVYEELDTGLVVLAPPPAGLAVEREGEG